MNRSWSICILCFVLFTSVNAFTFPKLPMNIEWEFVYIDEPNRTVELTCSVSCSRNAGSTVIDLVTSPDVILLEGSGKQEADITPGKPYVFTVKLRIDSEGEHFIRAVAISKSKKQGVHDGLKGVGTATIDLQQGTITLGGVRNYHVPQGPVDFHDRRGKDISDDERLSPEDKALLKSRDLKKGVRRRFPSKEAIEREQKLNEEKKPAAEKKPSEQTGEDSQKRSLNLPAEGKNLRPYKPTGWDYPIVPSSEMYTHTVGPNLTGGEYTYIDWAVLSDGTENVTETFYANFYLDDVYIGYMVVDDGLEVGYYAYLEDDWYTIDEGYHTLKMIVDEENYVYESNEGDNTYSRQFYWNPPPMPDLECYQPAGWDHPVVPSSEPNTHVVGPNLRTYFKTYIDWAIRNSGTEDVFWSFSVALLIDDFLVEEWRVDGLDSYIVETLEDYEYLFEQSGYHTLRVEVDYWNEIDESDEENNWWAWQFEWAYTETITVEGFFRFWDDNTSQYVPIKNAMVRIWDEDYSGGDDTLKTGYTDETGYFSIGPIPNVDVDDNDGFLDVYARLYAEGKSSRVINASWTTWSFRNPYTWWNVAGGIIPLGFLAAPEEDDGAYNIFDVLLSGYKWYDQRQSFEHPPQVRAKWHPDMSDSGTYYYNGTIYLLGCSSEQAPDEWDNGVILHEYGHFIAEQMEIDDSPGGMHWLTDKISRELAWSEGWASYVSCQVRNYSVMTDKGFDTSIDWNLETGEIDVYDEHTQEHEYENGNALGDDCEASVSGILWDIADNTDDDWDGDGIGDELHEGVYPIWYVIEFYMTPQGHHVYTVIELWNGWISSGFGQVPQLWATCFEHAVNQDEVAPSVTVLEPNGYELLYGGGEFIIEWNASDNMSGIDQVAIYYSTNSGTTYPYVITEDTENDGQYAWTVPATYSSECKVKVAVTDRAGGSAEDESDLAFEIAKILSLEVPNGNELLAVGSTWNVKWDYLGPSAGVSQFDVSYSIDGGASYDPVGSCDGCTEHLLWEGVSGPVSVQCLVMVTAQLTGGGSHSCTSDGFFSIYYQKTEWEPDGVLICDNRFNQQFPHIVSDGDGGAIITWLDRRSTWECADVYAGRIGADGTLIWPIDGVPVCTAAQFQGIPCIIPDGSGGAIIGWEDSRSGSKDIYAQRIDGNGDAQWATNGVVVCSAPGSQWAPRIAPDGIGGAVLVWYDDRNGNEDVYCQRIDENGTVQWTADGVAACTNGYDQWSPEIVSNSPGGAIVVWRDNRVGLSHADIYAQRINASGTVQWAANGIAVCAATNFQNYPRIVPDGSGGAIVAWFDQRNGNNEIYAQRVDSSGTFLWTTNGVSLCTGGGAAVDQQIVHDGNGGAVVAWSDSRSGNSDIYVQRVDAGGSAVWDPGGVATCSMPYNQTDPQLIPVGAGGAVVFWVDERNADADVYVQKVNEYGIAEWDQDGFPVCTKYDNQVDLQIIPDGNDGALVAWNSGGYWGSGYTEDTKDAKDLKDVIYYFSDDVTVQRIEGLQLGAPGLPDCEVSAVIKHGENEHLPSEMILFGCPHGDRGYELIVTCDFDDDDMAAIGEVSPEEIILITPEDTFSFCDTGNDDTPGTAGNGYVVTLHRVCISGCTSCNGCSCPTDVPVLYDGYEIGKIESLEVRSIDVIPDGFVDLSDLSQFAMTYNKVLGDPGYDCRYDYNADDMVDLSDFSLLGSHYQHHCPWAAAPKWLAAKTKAEVILSLDAVLYPRIGEPSKLYVTLKLENLCGLSTMAIGLDNEHIQLEYVDWIVNPRFPGVAAVSPVTRDGRNQLFLAAFGMESAHEASIEMGTLVYIVKNDERMMLDAGGSDFADEFSIVFGDLLDADGTVTTIREMEYRENAPVYCDHLSDNYPNPFNPATTIEYSIAAESAVNLSIYNVNGQLVKTLVDELQAPNLYSVTWDGKDKSGSYVASGVYFYRLVTNRFSKSKKLVLLR